MIESHFKSVSDVQDGRSKNLVNLYGEFFVREVLRTQILK